MALSSIIVSTDEVTRTKILFSSIYSPLMIFIILLLMFLSAFFGIGALSVKKWHFVLANKFLKHCKSEIESSDDLSKTNDDLLKTIIDEYVDVTQKNADNNAKIASYLKISHRFFLSGLFGVIIYFIYTMNLVY